MYDMNIYDCLSEEGKRAISERVAPDLIKYSIELAKNATDLSKQFEPTLLGLISKKRLQQELEITDKTLDKWRMNGLKQYQPPLEDTRKIYYRVSDIFLFLGVDK